MMKTFRRVASLGFLVCLATSLPAQTVPPTTICSEKQALDVPPLPDVHVRAHELVHQLFGFQAVFETLPGTAFDEGRNFPHEWGRTWGGLGKRFWNQYSQFLLSESIEFGVSAVHHEDPRYFRLGTGSFGGRTWHAVRSAFVARSSTGGGDKIALGRISGVYGAWAIAARWSPDSVHGVAPFLLWGSFGMGTKAGANFLREFWPRANRKRSDQNPVGVGN
jgi:hypothetical protein